MSTPTSKPKVLWVAFHSVTDSPYFCPLQARGTFEYRLVEPESSTPEVLSANAECPLCGHEGPHPHTPLEQSIYRNGLKAGQSRASVETLEQQPVAWRVKNGFGQWVLTAHRPDHNYMALYEPLYTVPAQKANEGQS